MHRAALLASAAAAAILCAMPALAADPGYLQARARHPSGRLGSQLQDRHLRRHRRRPERLRGARLVSVPIQHQWGAQVDVLIGSATQVLLGFRGHLFLA